MPKVRVLVSIDLRLLHQLRKTLPGCQKSPKGSHHLFMIANLGEEVLIEGSRVSEGEEVSDTSKVELPFTVHACLMCQERPVLIMLEAEAEDNKSQKTLLWAGCCERGRGVDLYSSH